MKNQNKATHRIIAVATGVGGHFLNGRRAKGYAYFLGLLVWPFIFFAAQVALSLALHDRPLNPILSASVFVLGFFAIWTVSVIQAISDRTTRPLSDAQSSIFETVFITFATYGVALYCLLAFVLAPQLEPGQRIKLFEFSRSTKAGPASVPKLLPTESGNVVLVGTLAEKDRPLSNGQLALLFQDGYRTPTIRTDELGKFEYRLPPGDWRFVGPLVSGLESRPVYVVFTPGILQPTFNVGAGVPIKKVDMKIVVE